MTDWPILVLVIVAGIWSLTGVLLAAVAARHVYRSRRHRRRAGARAEVRSALAALAQGSRKAARPDVEWWLAHADALDAEVTPALIENPSVRAALEALATAASPEVLRLALAPASGSGAAAGRDRSRLHQAARLVSVAPTRSARRALLALQSGSDASLGILASAALARHAATFADTSAPLAGFLSLGPERERALAGRWALGRIIDGDPRRAVVHLQDVAPAVQSAALATLNPRAVAGAGNRRGELVALALARTTDADADVRAAAFRALSRVNDTLPAEPVEKGLADADETVRTAAARVLPLVGHDALSMLPLIERADAGLGRAVRRALRARASKLPPRAEPGRAAPERTAFFHGVAAVPTADAETSAAQGLSDADAGVRREAALALAAIARLGATPRLDKHTVDALLTRLKSESAGPVSMAIIEALEATDDERAAAALAALAKRAKPKWRLRLTEASTLARRIRGSATRRGGSVPSGPSARPSR